jgi:mannan polymerase II complex MNN11 subunit
MVESLAIVNQSIVPPYSVITTHPNMKGEHVDIILTQDGDGLSVDSFLIRTGDWAKFLLDMWFDPLYRSYDFAAAEKHALEHIVQWHMTVLSRLVLVPQKLFNAYWYEKGKPVGTKDAGK